MKSAPVRVAWRENSDGRKPLINPATGRAAASDTPNTWGTWKAADKRAQRFRNGLPSGVGIVLGGDEWSGRLAALWRRSGWLHGPPEAVFRYRDEAARQLHRTLPRRRASRPVPLSRLGQGRFARRGARPARLPVLRG